MTNSSYVEYEGEFGRLYGGYVIDMAVSPLTGKTRLEVADSPNDDEGKWIYASACREVPTERRARKESHDHNR